MYKKILVPYDTSEPAHHALAEAISLVEDSDGIEVTVLNVIDWHEYDSETFKIASLMSGAPGNSIDAASISDVETEIIEKTTKEITEDLADIIKNAPFVNIVAIHGSPHDSITDYAAENNYDCIAMGHRGLGAVRGMLGSVCYSVLHKTDKPVLVVK